MQGLNTPVTFYRATQQADDQAGGAQRSPYYQYSTGRARIQQRPVDLQTRAQGLTTDKLFDAFVQPADLGIQAMDMLIPTAGPFAHLRFLVTAAITHTLAQPRGPKAHVRLQLERWDDGKVIDLQ